MWRCVCQLTDRYLTLLLPWYSSIVAVTAGLHVGAIVVFPRQIIRCGLVVHYLCRSIMLMQSTWYVLDWSTVFSRQS